MNQTCNPTTPAMSGEFDNPGLLQRLREEPAPPWTARDGIFLAAAVIVGLILVEWGLWGGLNLGFSIGYALLLIWTAAYRGASGQQLKPFALFCGAASLAAAGLFAWSADYLLSFMWLGMIALLYCIFTASLYGLEPGDGLYRITDALACIVPAPFRNLHRPLQSIAATGRTRGGRVARQVALGLALAVPVLAIVLPLLIGSDAAFEGLARSLVGNLGDAPVQIILGLIAAVLIFSLGFALRKGLVPARKHATAARDGVLGATAALTLLSALILVYAAYLLSQLAYFFSAFSGILPEGYVFTAAEYARRGFFELCAVCAVNLLVVCIVARLTRRAGDGRAPAAVRALCGAVCIFCLIFAATALSKMALYVRRFGLTRLRLLTTAFMLLIVFTLVCVLVQLFARRMPCVQAVLIFACVLGLVLGYAEPDALVARYNVQRYNAGTLETIDVDYLDSLSAAAVPQLIGLLDCPDETVRTAAAAALDRKLDFYLTEELHRIPDSSLRSYNHRLATVQALLHANAERIGEILAEAAH